MKKVIRQIRRNRTMWTHIKEVIRQIRRNRTMWKHIKEERRDVIIETAK